MKKINIAKQNSVENYDIRKKALNDNCPVIPVTHFFMFSSLNYSIFIVYLLLWKQYID